MLRAATVWSLSLLALGVQALRKGDSGGHLSQDPDFQRFLGWAWEHKRQYLDDDAEVQRRFDIWLDNKAYVEEYNKQATTHRLGLNVHADLTHEEFKAFYLGYDAEKAAAARAARLAADPGHFAAVEAELADGAPPGKLDWRDHNAVTYVKNQKQCGACWAFSTTGSVEGVNAIVTGELEVLSEQELLDCDTHRTDAGCNGGLMDTAFDFVVDNGGLDTEDDYKYHAKQGQCNVKRENRHVVTIDGHHDVPPGQSHLLKKAVAKQPVSVAIQANQRPFQLYTGGVFTEPCGAQLDHGVLVVGYGTDSNGTDFWTVKNSWGEGWGEQGYIRLVRTDEPGPGQCGVAQMPSYPTKQHANPPWTPPIPPDPSPPPPAPSPTPGPSPGPSPGPGPSPSPVQCDSRASCPAEMTCCCMLPLIANVCIQWACCPAPHATCCPDHIHCCPENLPVCGEGRCMANATAAGGDALLQSIPWLEKVPATQDFSRVDLMLQDNAATVEDSE